MMKNIWNHQKSRIRFLHAREGWLGSLQMERRTTEFGITLPISFGKALVIDRCWYTRCVHMDEDTLGRLTDTSIALLRTFNVTK